MEKSKASAAEVEAKRKETEEQRQRVEELKQVCLLLHHKCNACTWVTLG